MAQKVRYFLGHVFLQDSPFCRIRNSKVLIERNNQKTQNCYTYRLVEDFYSNILISLFTSKRLK